MGLNPNTAAVGLPGPETILLRPQYWVKAKKKGLQDGKQPGQSCSPALLTLCAPAAGRQRTRVVLALGVSGEHSSCVAVSAGQASCRNRRNEPRSKAAVGHQLHRSSRQKYLTQA